MNVLSVHATILNRFKIEQRASMDTMNTIKSLLTEALDDSLTDELRKRMALLSTNAEKNLYLAKAAPLIKQYVTALSEPVSVYDEKCVAAKNVIANNFFAIIKNLLLKKRWTDIRSVEDESTGSSKFYCDRCGNATKFEIDDGTKKITCSDCSTQINTIETGHTHQDYNRVNIVGKFVYNRVLHFQDCIKQFQGKQNCKIPDKLYADLDGKFKAYRLLIESDNVAVKYSKITPQHILMFLKELKYAKHYENVNAIYYVLTNKRVADISHIEHKLMEDFKELIALYDNLHSKDKPEELNRKNFMNVQYILFQLLRRHGYPCKIEEFSILKTIDRKIFHDKICSNLFEKLGWNFTPTF